MTENNNVLTEEGRLIDVKKYFDEESELTDSILRVEDKSLYVNKSFIALASKELASKFALPEGATTGKMEATLEGKKYTDVLDMMTYIYPNFRVFIDRTNVEALLTMAFEYEIDILMKKCAQVMMGILNDYRESKVYLEQEILEIVLQYLKLADMTCFADVRKVCMEIICKQFYARKEAICFNRRIRQHIPTKRGFVFTTAFKALSKEVQQEIILSRLTFMESQHGDFGTY